MDNDPHGVRAESALLDQRIQPQELSRCMRVANHHLHWIRIIGHVKKQEAVVVQRIFAEFEFVEARGRRSAIRRTSKVKAAFNRGSLKVIYEPHNAVEVVGH